MTATLIKDASYNFVPSKGIISSILTIITIWLLTTGHANSQDNVFSARIITDLNFSQIRGDLLAGYHRIGYGAGIGVSYQPAPQWNGHLELMYRNAGSRNSPFSSVKRSINIHLAQIPIYASYLTWWDNGLSRIHFDIGMIYGRVINYTIHFPEFSEKANFINDNDISLMAGMGFWFNRHHGIKARYVRSLSILMENEAENIKWQLYYISLQYHYRF